MNLKVLEVMVKGLATHIPGYQRLLDRFGFSCPGGTITPEYCYSVWLRHLEQAHRHGLSTEPAVVAELGPGNSLGVGLCALLTGARAYYAVDVEVYANTPRNLYILSELTRFLKEKHADSLSDTGFPQHILTEERLAWTLAPLRLNLIRQCLYHINQPVHDLFLGYSVPGNNSPTMRENSVDFILSHAVMEHVEDPEAVYRLLFRWLKPGGSMSHMIDYRSHNLAREWNGHWAYSEVLWKVMRSKRPYFINRQPHSAHAAAMRRCGFRLIGEEKTREAPGIAREQLAPPFRGLSHEDLTTATGFFVAVKPQD